MTNATIQDKCRDYAEDALSDHHHLWTQRRTEELAVLIRQTVTDYIATEQSNYEPPDPPGWEGGFADNH